MSDFVCARRIRSGIYCPVPRCSWSVDQWNNAEDKKRLLAHLDECHPDLVRG